jgi:predicted small secreted protein
VATREGNIAPTPPVLTFCLYIPRIITMRKHLSVTLTLLAAVPLLGACHTTAGAGEDISATGHALTNSADKDTPR